MKVEITMYTLKCDICGKHFEDEHNGFCAWNDFQGAKDNATDSDWVENTEIEDTHYCPDCITFNDEDEVINKANGELLFKN